MYVLRSVFESLLQWKSSKYYTFVFCLRTRVRMRACARSRERVHARIYVHVALLIQHATRMRHIVTSLVAPVAPPCFSTLCHKINGFRKTGIEHKKCVLILFITFSKAFLILRRI
jgi:hypothetical protein